MRILLIATAAFALNAQTPTFEAASIKPNKSAEGSSSTRTSPGHLTMRNVNLRKMTLLAHGIPDDREYAIVGPDWMGTERFDIEANFSGEAKEQEIRGMMRALLVERFKLKLHTESRQLPMYALTVAKNGPKITPVEAGPSRTSSGRGRVQATKVTMQKLADLLSRMIGQPVLDSTGMSGVYDFTLEFSPDETQKMVPLGAETAPAVIGPSIFSALQDQLGLKLEARKGPVDVLIVDQIERIPTAN